MRCTLFRVLKMEAKMDQLRALVEAADKDKVDLVNQLEEERRSVRPAESLIFLLIR